MLITIVYGAVKRVAVLKSYRKLVLIYSVGYFYYVLLQSMNIVSKMKIFIF